MPFPFRHANGNVCCTNKAIACDDCKAKLAAETGRTAAGKRHSVQDQQHLDAAHQHVIIAAGHLGAAGATHDASSIGAPGTSAAIEAEIEQRERAAADAHGNATQRYKAALSHTFAKLRADTRALEARAAAHPPTMRALEAPDDVPNGYASVTEHRAATQSDLTPDMDPDGYDPYGKPPNGHLLGLALRHLNAQEAK
jgi:hypothetical protein